jgi:hypothetical protein
VSQLGGGAPGEAIRVAEQLGLDRGQIRAVVPLSERHGHALWRLVTARQSYVLKWFPPGDACATEMQAYALLRQLGVPTLPVHAAAEDALLLEDLAASPEWRLASQEDVACAAVGRAVARWYRVFHRRGTELLARPGGAPGFLRREIDRLDGDSIHAAGCHLALGSQAGWRLAMAQIEPLKAAMRALPETLNYNDFYWTNLALSRTLGSEQQAIVFDYHLLGIGVRFSDCRNVVGSLAGDAVAAFWQEYGPPDEREEILDRPLSTLVALVTAARLSTFPRWARSSRDHVLCGGLERDLLAALELVRGWGL